MSLWGPTVLAFDQLDAIVTQHQQPPRRGEADAEEQTGFGWSIIRSRSGGGSVR